jgi:hypothetical protein
MSQWICDKCESWEEGVTVNNEHGFKLCGGCHEDWAREEERQNTRAIFTLGNRVFMGYDTGAQWNGWAVPEFDKWTTQAILLSLQYEYTVNTVTDAIIYVDDLDGDTYTMRPNNNDCFVFDGWAWEFAYGTGNRG